MADSQPPSTALSSPTVNITAKWQSTTTTFPFPLTATVADLHTHIAHLLNLSPALKLVGLTKHRLPIPSTPLSSLQLPGDVRVLVVGVRAEAASEVRAMDAAYSARRRDEEAREDERQRQREVRQRMEEDIRREQERVAEERRRAYDTERAERERKWQEEQARREQERREEELRAEQAGGHVTLTLSALLSPEADSKQKLILPPSALQSIVDAKVAFPLTFAVRKTGGPQREEEEEEKKKDDKDSQAAEVVYLGVADFSSPHSSVVLVPSSLLSSLQCSEGQSLTLSTITLPKATHITLVPLPSTSPNGSLVPSPFLSLSPPERTALLEFHLRRYQHLQRNQHLSFHYRRTQPALRFEVKDTQPADVVSIIDADVQAEVEAGPADGVETGGEGSKGGEGDRVVPVMVGVVVEGELTKGQYWRGRVRMDEANGRYEVSVRSVKGDADLYVVRCERTNAEVDATYWDWRGVEVGDDRIVLSSDEARWQPGEFDIAVRAYEADCAFKLTVNLLPSAAPTASSSSAPASTTSTASAATAADTSLCPNCHKPIPARSLAMHELQCRRNNTACPDCHAVLLTRHLPKHRHTTHAPTHCPACSLALPPAALAQHRRDACMGRLVECAYCPLLVTAEERGEHSAADGLFTSACAECGEVMQRKVIRRHMRLQHGRNEREITWRDFF